MSTFSAIFNLRNLLYLIYLVAAGADKSQKPLEIRAFGQKESTATLIPIVSKLRCFFEALVDTETWDKVQAILASRINGTRNLKHPHFLKGSIFCAYCGERMMVSNEKKKDGTIYPYFIYSGRHSKRRKDCTTKAVLINVIEKEIEKILFVIIFNAIFFLLPNHIITDFFII